MKDMYDQLSISTESGESVDNFNMRDYLETHIPFDLKIYISVI